MDDFLQLIQFLYNAGAAVIPWLVLAIFVVVLFKLTPSIIAWINSRTDAQQNMAVREAERNEILRHNNVVITNCSETISMIKTFVEDRDEKVLSAVDHHELMSEERIAHLQKVLDRNSSEIGKLRGDTGILLDRNN